MQRFRLHLNLSESARTARHRPVLDRHFSSRDAYTALTDGRGQFEDVLTSPSFGYSQYIPTVVFGISLHQNRRGVLGLQGYLRSSGGTQFAEIKYRFGHLTGQ